jgi:hypothetical protein
MSDRFELSLELTCNSYKNHTSYYQKHSTQAIPLVFLVLLNAHNPLFLNDLFKNANIQHAFVKHLLNGFSNDVMDSTLRHLI